MIKNRPFRFFLSLAIFAQSALLTAHADDPSSSIVSINGSILSEEEKREIEKQNGEPLAPGNYVVDWDSGCWANITTGVGHCEVQFTAADREANEGSRASKDATRQREVTKAKKTVIINGFQLTDEQIASLETYIGTAVVPGNYLVNPQNGCWLNTWTAESGCGIGGNSGGGEYASGYSSGEWTSGGDWSHHSDIAGGSVGGSADGCVYAFGWSNC